MIGVPAGGSEESDFAGLLAARPEINTEKNAARRRVLVPLDSGRFCHDSASSTIQRESEAAQPFALRWLFREPDHPADSQINYFLSCWLPENVLPNDTSTRGSPVFPVGELTHAGIRWPAAV